jgi:hypothetical protein
MGKNSSFEKINYSLRPSKSIERKMIIPFLYKLTNFDELINYHYIGFGSIYYSDFILFHKNLNICRMSSIEYERNESRAKFNLPYKCIDLFSGTSNDKLVTIMSNDEKYIAWLDYDSPMSNSTLDDIQTFIYKSTSGSLLMITLNVNSDDKDELNSKFDELFEYRKTKLEKRITKNKIPQINKANELNLKNLHKVYRKIIINEIEETLIKKNKLQENKYKFKQIMNFRYSDNAQMQTFSFLIYEESDEEKYNACKFDDLLTFKNNDEPYEIKSPHLTIDEIRKLNKILPLDTDEDIKSIGIENNFFINAAKDYAEVYQYFPNFSESLY